MLSVSFDPIFSPDDIPVAPLSVSEEKLLKKVAKLAQMLTLKHSEGTMKKSTSSFQGRRFLLLKSLMTILTALGGNGKTLGDDRLLELTDILAHFSFDAILKLEWIDILDLKNKVTRAKGLVALHVWRKNLRGESTKGFLQFTEIEPFAYAYDKRRILIETLKYKSQKLKTEIVNVWRVRTAETIAQRLFDRWKLEVLFMKWKALAKGTAAAIRYDHDKTRFRMLQLWKQRAMEKVYEDRLAYRLLELRKIKGRTLFPAISPFDLIGRAGDLAACSHVFESWRSKARLSVHLKAKSKDAKFEAWSIWNKKTANVIWLQKTADFHNKIRLTRPCFNLMSEQCKRFREAENYISGHSKLKMWHQYMQFWRKAMKQKQIKKKCFAVMRRKASFLSSASFNSKRLYDSTVKIKILQMWRRALVDREVFNTKAKVMTTSFEIMQLRSRLNGWKKLVTKHRRLEEHTIAWRIRHELITKLGLWNHRAVDSYNSKTIRRKLLLRSTMVAWKFALVERQENARLVSVTFGIWKRRTKAREALRNFAGSRLLTLHSNAELLNPSDILAKMHSIKGIKDCQETVMKRVYFANWHSRGSKQSNLMNLLKSFEAKQKSAYLRKWKLSYASREFIEKSPEAKLVIAWNKFRKSVHLIRQRKLLLEVKLHETLGAQDFLSYFRSFKTWEKAFQVRKMEEHLCGQNLMSYEQHVRTKTLRKWKLLATQHVFVQYREKISIRSAVLKQWRQSTKQIAVDRNNRLAKRVIEVWGYSLLVSHSNTLKRLFEKRQRKKCLDTWRSRAVVKRCRQKVIDSKPAIYKMDNNAVPLVTPWFKTIAGNKSVPSFDDQNVPKASKKFVPSYLLPTLSLMT